MIFYFILFFIINYGIYIKGSYGLQVLQETSYNLNNKYFKWCQKNIKLSFLHLDLLSFIFVIIALFLKNKVSLFLLVLAIIFVIIDTEMIRYANTMGTFKNKLQYTIRLILVIIIILILIDLPFVYYLINPSIKYQMLLIEFIILIGINFLIPIVNYLVTFLVNIYYLGESIIAKNTLKRLPNLQVIGIIGSYGKSNILNLLNDILGQDILISKINNKQYNFFFKSIKLLNKDTKYFAVEIGSQNNKELKKICQIINPNIGIITSDCIHQGLIKSISNGIIIYNQDTLSISGTFSYSLNNKKSDIYASDIKVTESGTNFKVSFKDLKKSFVFKTKLLGKYNVYNILAIISYLRVLNLSIKDIQTKINKLPQQVGYLNVIKNNKIVKINDQSSANPEGIKDALNVLKVFKGLKIIVTPGMINLGNKEDYYNHELGEYLAKVCDYVILVGDIQTKSIQAGLKDSNFDYHKVLVTNDYQEVNNIINNINSKQKKIILYENNLLDIYSE